MSDSDNDSTVDDNSLSEDDDSTVDDDSFNDDDSYDDDDLTVSNNKNDNLDDEIFSDNNDFGFSVDNDSYDGKSNNDDSYDDDSYDNDDASYQESLSEDGEERTRHVSEEVVSKRVPCTVFDDDYRDESRSIKKLHSLSPPSLSTNPAPTQISRSRINNSATSYEIRSKNAWRRENAAIKIQTLVRGYIQRQYFKSQMSCTFAKMATCILNIFIDGDNRDATIITSAEFRRDEFFDAKTEKFFFDSNDTDVDQESILCKVLQEFMYDATYKLQEERRIFLAREVKNENFDFPFIDKDGDEMSNRRIGKITEGFRYGIIDTFDEMTTSPVIVNATIYIKGYYPDNADDDADVNADNDADKKFRRRRRPRSHQRSRRRCRRKRRQRRHRYH